VYFPPAIKQAYPFRPAFYLRGRHDNLFSFLFVLSAPSVGRRRLFTPVPLGGRSLLLFAGGGGHLGPPVGFSSKRAIQFPECFLGEYEYPPLRLIPTFRSLESRQDTLLKSRPFFIGGFSSSRSQRFQEALPVCSLIVAAHHPSVVPQGGMGLFIPIPLSPPQLLQIRF